MAKTKSLQSEQKDSVPVVDTRVYVWGKKLQPRGGVFDEKGIPKPEMEYGKERYIPLTGSVVWPGGDDPFSQKPRSKGRYQVRYYEGCTTIFADDQPKDILQIEELLRRTKQIIFVNGYLEVPSFDVMLVAYLDMVSFNIDSEYRNPKAASLFQKLDAEKIAQEEIAKEDIIERAMELARTAGEKHMRLHAKFLGIIDYDEKSGLKFDEKAMRAKYRKEARTNPENFVGTYSDKTLQLTEWIKDALFSGKISTTIIPNNAVWAEKGVVICGTSGLKSSDSVLNKLIEFSQTPDGEEFYEHLKGIYE